MLGILRGLRGIDNVCLLCNNRRVNHFWSWHVLSEESEPHSAGVAGSEGLAGPEPQRRSVAALGRRGSGRLDVPKLGLDLRPALKADGVAKGAWNALRFGPLIFFGFKVLGRLGHG